MNIDGVLLEKNASGWELQIPYSGKDKKTKKDKVQYKTSYHSRIDQALAYLRDHLSKDCQSVSELIELWKDTLTIDQQVLASVGLTDNPKSIPVE
jgi:hypothetical protein